jgi:hypothetical protein
MEAGLRLAEDVVEPDITCNVKHGNYRMAAERYLRELRAR